MKILPQPIARRNSEMSRHASAGPTCFRRDLLPVPSIFYEHELGKLSRPSRGWVRTACPFHRGKNRSAFSIHLQSGAFYCFNCGVKGGDVIAFVMLREGADFKTAAQLLGAWELSSQRSTRGEVRRLKERDRCRRAADDLVVAESSLRLQYRAAIHGLEADQRRMTDRLHDPAITLAESEDCWARLRVTADQLRRAVAGYHLLSFGPIAERAAFILHPDLRDAAIQAVLLRGFVRGDDGRSFEVIL